MNSDQDLENDDLRHSMSIALANELELLTHGNVTIALPGPSRIVAEPDVRLAFHRQSEVVIQVRGTMQCHFESGARLLEPGDVGVVLPFRKHEWRVHHQSVDDFAYLLMEFCNGRLWLHFGERQKNGNGVRIASVILRRTYAPTEYALDALNQTIGNFDKNAHAVSSATYLLFASILQLVDTDQVTTPGRRPALIVKCTEYMEFKLHDPRLSVAEMATVCGCSASHLSRVFKKSLGHGPIEHLNTLRLEACAELLRNSELPICDVAWACGYTQANYMARLFRRKYNQTPRRYRRD